MNKVIWMSWLQGLNDPNIPLLNKVCFKRWKYLNYNWDVIVIDKDNIKHYVPEYFDIIDGSNAPIQKQANLLRLLLLKKYGGIWADASLYPEKCADEFIDKILNDTGFFSYRFIPRSLSVVDGNRETVNWFLVSGEPNHYLISKWLDKISTRYTHNFDWKKYFQMHEDLCELYDSDDKIKSIINNMVQVSEQIPHCCVANYSGIKEFKFWNDRIESYVYKRPCIPNSLLEKMLNE